MASRWAINMAALVADEHLHGTRTFWAFHNLWSFTSRTWDIKPATMADGLNNSIMVLFEGELEALFPRNLLPFLKIFQNPQDCEPVTSSHHGGPFAQNCPTALVLVGKQLLDLLGNWVDLFVNFCEEQALYSRPEPTYNSMVFTSFTTLSDAKYLNLYLRIFDDWVVCKCCGSLCELLDPLVVVASIEEDVFFLFNLFDKNDSKTQNLVLKMESL